MASANPTRQNSVLLIALLFGQLLLMSSSVRSRDGATLLESAIRQATMPITWVAGTVGGSARSMVDGIRRTLVARAENRRLREEVRRLVVENSRLREESLETDRLRRMLSMREPLVPDAIGASVVTANLSEDVRMLVIDRGTSEGVRVDQAVVAWGGAVGRVVEADPRFAKVRVLSDPNSGVAGIVQRSRAGGMVFGQGDERLAMVYVTTYSDVQLGDVVVTSGLDGVFPRGFRIGQVVYVGDEDVSKTIRLQPEVEFAALEEVLVLLEPIGGALLSPPEIEVEP